MKILAIDTSGAAGSVVVSSDNDVLSEVSTTNVGTHSTWLMGAVSKALNESGVKKEALDYIALGTGPGSFTGLRIGVSTVKGLAWALDKPVIGVSVLRALATNAKESGKNVTICPVLDARKSEVYAALFNTRGNTRGNTTDKPLSGGIERVSEDLALTPAKLKELLKAEGCGEVLFLGSGIKRYAEELLAMAGEGVSVNLAPEELWHVSAVNISRIALRQLKAKKEEAATTALKLLPKYLRKSEAELKKKAALS